jgi:hypothetical protein
VFGGGGGGRTCIDALNNSNNNNDGRKIDRSSRNFQATTAAKSITLCSPFLRSMIEGSSYSWNDLRPFFDSVVHQLTSASDLDR